MDIKEIALKAGYSTVPAYWLSDEKPIACSTSNFEKLVSFAEALIESYKAELLKEVGEPVGLVTFVDGECYAELSDTAKLVEFDELFTSDQVTTAITKATKQLEEEVERLTEWEQAVVCECMACDACLDCSDPRKTVKNIREYYFTWGMEEQKTVLETGLILELRDQLTKAEQRVAEACALQVATETRFHWLDAARVAKEIRSGEWKRYLK